jgi:hypothetical protein
MIKSSGYINLPIRKIFSIALTLVFAMTSVAAGSLAGLDCGAKCCCQTNPNSMMHGAGEHIRASKGCCSGSPMIPCDWESSQKSDLPEITLGAAGSNLSHASGTAVISNRSPIDGRNFGGTRFSRPSEKIIKSPPIYLQKLSFLI